MDERTEVPTDTPDSEPGDSPPAPIVYKGVRGWLWLFCFILTVVNPIAVLVSVHRGLRSLGPQLEQMADLTPWAFLVALAPIGIHLILSLGLAVLSLYAGFMLWRVRPRAVQTAKLFLWYALTYQTLAVGMTLLTESPPGREVLGEAVRHLFRALLTFSIWYSYLQSSKRVQATCTLEESKEPT